MTAMLDTAGGAATSDLLAAMSRRSLLRRGLGGAGGLALAGGGLFEALEAEVAQAAPMGVTPAREIFTIAQTAEQLAVTLYSHGVEAGFGLAEDDLDYFKAAGIQEQIHQKFFARLTGVKVQKTTHFSFPAGANTFKDLRLFIIAQQHLEGVFDTAFLAAVKELARQRMPRAAQIMAQIATNEAEHRVLARVIAAERGIDTLPNINPGGSGRVPTDPPDNWAFTPVFVARVSDVVGLAKRDGFMNPRAGNDFVYRAIDFQSPLYHDVFERISFRQPFAQRRHHM
jgi:hypothetical protein